MLLPSGYLCYIPNLTSSLINYFVEYIETHALSLQADEMQFFPVANRDVYAYLTFNLSIYLGLNLYTKPIPKLYLAYAKVHIFTLRPSLV